jgi:hypothetical protein
VHRTDLNSFHFRTLTWEIFLLLLLAVAVIVVQRSLLWVIPVCVGSLLGFKFTFSEEMDNPPDARCGALCSFCTSFQNGHCPSCAFGDENVRLSCPLFVCAEKKETLCTVCPEMLHCTTYRNHANTCPFVDALVLQDTLPPGGGYLVYESNLNKSLFLFADRIARGDFGLVILRQPPDMLAGVPQIERVPILQLTQTVTERSCLDPTNLAKIHLTIEEFFRAAPKATVFLEGMEYLIIHNGVDRILKFIHSIAECAGKYSSRFITLIDPRVLEDDELTLLEEELIRVESDFEK